MVKRILGVTLALFVALSFGSTSVFAAKGPSGTGSSGGSSSRSTSTISAAKSRGPSGTSDNTMTRAQTTTNRGPGGTGNTSSVNTKKPVSSSSTSNGTRRTTTTTTTTVASHRYYSGFGAYGGYCWTCFSGSYAYGPVGFAGYYPPAPVEGFIVLGVLVLLVLLFLWWRSRRDRDYYDGATEATVRSSTTTHRHRDDEDIWP